MQKAAKVVGDRAAWADEIREEAMAQRRAGRATFVVCETIRDVKGFADNLRGSFPQLQTYTSAGQRLVFLDPDHPRAVESGDLIIATNLAGRDTNFTTSAALEEAGGLHVVPSYLPGNIRIQEQAFGRTARKDNGSTGGHRLRPAMSPHRRALPPP